MAKKHDVTTEDAALVGLSDEERAALEEQDEDQTTLEEIAGEDDAEDEADDDASAEAKDDDEDEGEDSTEGAEGKDTVEAAAGDDTEPGAEGKDSVEGAAADDAADEEDDELQVPRTMRMALPADFTLEKYEQDVGSLNQQLAEAAKQFKDGDLEWEDYAAKEQEIRGKRDALNAKRVQFDQAIAHNEAADRHDWGNTVEAFMRAAKREGVDYAKATVKVGKKDEPLLDVFDRTVKALANDPANAERTGTWFLREADAIVRARFGLTAAKGGKDKGGKQDTASEDAKRKAVKGRKPDLRSVPKTLGGLPAAGETEAGVDDGEFAHLEKLSGMELENAVAKMTPAQQERWAQQAA